MTEPADPFASPIVGPTPFATPTASASPVCPKCGWHQPDGARSCAACGLIFARYAEAERRRAAAATPPGRPVDDVDALPMSPVGFSGPMAPEPAPLRVGEVLGSAATGATGALWPLIALQFMPVLAAIGLGIAGAAFVPALVAAQGQMGTATLVVMGVLALLVCLRVAGGILAGTLVAVDDAMEGIEARGALATIGEGWARGGRALGVWVVMGLAMLVPALPFGVAVQRGAGAPVLLGLGVVAAVGAFVIGLRLSLALPLAVLGQREVGESLSDSWALTGSVLVPVALSLVAATALSVVVSLVLSMFAIVPIVGWVAGFVGQALVAGFGMAVVAGLFRRLVPRQPRYT